MALHKTKRQALACRLASFPSNVSSALMFTSLRKVPPSHPPKISPSLRNKNADPASEPLTSTSLKSFSVPLSFHLHEQDSGCVFSAAASRILQIRGGGF